MDFDQHAQVQKLFYKFTPGPDPVTHHTHLHTRTRTHTYELKEHYHTVSRQSLAIVVVLNFN